MYYYFIYLYMHFGMEWWEKRNSFLLWTPCATRVFCLHNVYISLSSGIILIKIHYCVNFELEHVLSKIDWFYNLIFVNRILYSFHC